MYPPNIIFIIVTELFYQNSFPESFSESQRKILLQWSFESTFFILSQMEIFAETKENRIHSASPRSCYIHYNISGFGSYI